MELLCGEKMRYFDLDKRDNELLNYINYGKSNGLIAAFKNNFPVSTTGWICTSSSNTVSEIPKSFLHNKFLCRPDAPSGLCSKLPRGIDLTLEQVLVFCENIQLKVSNAIVLVFIHPSILLTGRYIPRYSLSGGVMVMVDKNDSVTIEYVGKGFDVGEITRGRHVHTSIKIPFSVLYEVLEIQSDRWNNIKSITWENISSDQYLQSRYFRIQELRNLLEKETNINFDEIIQLEIPGISCDILNSIMKLIKPILLSNSKRLGNTFGIMINLYENMPYVFEIYKPARSSTALHF